MLLSGLSFGLAVRAAIRKALVVVASAALVGSALVPGVAANAVDGTVTVACSTGSFDVVTNGPTVEVQNGSTCAGTAPIPASVTLIGVSAFEDAINLTAVTFGDHVHLSSLSAIFQNAFKGTTNLEQIKMPDSGPSVIGSSAFENSGLFKIDIMGGMTSMFIGQGAFKNALRLESVTLPVGVTLGLDAFLGTEALRSITFLGDAPAYEGDFHAEARGYISASSRHSSFTSMSGMSDLQFVNTPDILCPPGDTQLGHMRMAGSIVVRGSCEDAVVIPEGVTAVGPRAFSWTDVRSVVLPSTLTSIGLGAFEFTQLLTSINLPDGLTSIPDQAFSYSGLTSLNIPAAVTRIGAYAFYNAGRLGTLSFSEGSALQTIGSRAFFHSVMLQTVTIPRRVLEIGDFAFACTAPYPYDYDDCLTTSSREFIFLGDAPLTGSSAFIVANAQPATSAGVARIGALATGFEDLTANDSVVDSMWNGLTVVRAAASHTVTYNLNGGSGAAPTQVSLASAASFTVSREVFTRAGYTFGGWSDGSAVFSAGATFTVGSAPVALTAIWTAAVVDNQGGGEPSTTPPVVIPTPTPTPTAAVKPISVAQAVLRVSPTTGTPVLAGIAASKPIVFGADSAKLDAVDMATLRKLVATFPSTKGVLVITGFVSSKGKATAAGRKLAAARAKAVALALAKLGMDVQVGYAGYGARNTVSPTAGDRRVEIRWVATK